ncbi:MAG: hypothetical protein M1828_000786 [Chrysothrix sp. TS-e1954]|nr:MAG: hypothetical protein M1828_000786 [Chrysothrix sp. TS-e1954]
MTVKARYGSDSGRGKAYIAITIIFATLALSSVLLRIYALHLRQRSFQLHDYLILAAGVVSIGYLVDAIHVAIPGGLGLHIGQVLAAHPEGAVDVNRDFFVSKPIWVTTTTLTKLSILQFLVSIFTKSSVRWATAVIATLSCLFWLAYVLETFLLCRPLAYSWDKTIAGGRCGSAYADTLGPPIVNLLLDFMITVLPMPSLWALQIPRRTKLQLSGILGLGLGVCAMNIARVAYVSHVNLDDFTYVLLLIGLLANLEVYLGIIIACLPTLGPVLQRGKSSRGATTTSSWLSRSLPHLRSRRGTSRDIGSGGQATTGPKEDRYVRLDEGMLPLTNLARQTSEPEHESLNSPSKVDKPTSLGLESISSRV